jgi:hypothetical protein
MPRPTERAVIFSDLPLFAERGGGVATQPAADDAARAYRVPDYDVCERRSGDQGGSGEANERAAPSKQQMRDAVLAAVLRAGSLGLTLRELAARWELPMHTLSGRFSELRDLGLIARRLDVEGKPVIREGCGIWLDRHTADCECPF